MNSIVSSASVSTRKSGVDGTEHRCSVVEERGGRHARAVVQSR